MVYGKADRMIEAQWLDAVQLWIAWYWLWLALWLPLRNASRPTANQKRDLGGLRKPLRFLRA